ncbi:hypothetical protein H8958_020366 [Nasalis larvatus]
MMMHGHNNGKKPMTVHIVKHAFEIILLLMSESTLQVLVNAIINSGPWEDPTCIGGTYEASFQNIKTIAECLEDELISATKGSSNSYVIKKDELG